MAHAPAQNTGLVLRVREDAGNYVYANRAPSVGRAYNYWVNFAYAASVCGPAREPPCPKLHCCGAMHHP